MRKVFLLLLGAFWLSTSANAWEPIPLSVIYEDDRTPIGNGHPKAPIHQVAPPNLYIDGWVLSFTNEHPECTLNIKDEDENVVYTTFVSSETTLVSLPTTLSGDYEIELIIGYWKFTGWINL